MVPEGTVGSHSLPDDRTPSPGLRRRHRSHRACCHQGVARPALPRGAARRPRHLPVPPRPYLGLQNHPAACAPRDALPASSSLLPPLAASAGRGGGGGDGGAGGTAGPAGPRPGSAGRERRSQAGKRAEAGWGRAGAGWDGAGSPRAAGRRGDGRASEMHGAAAADRSGAGRAAVPGKGAVGRERWCGWDPALREPCTPFLSRAPPLSLPHLTSPSRCPLQSHGGAGPARGLDASPDGVLTPPALPFHFLE